MRYRMRAKVEIEEIEEGEGQAQIGEEEILEALDGAFEQMLLESEGESIDDLEAGLMRLQYVAGRAAMARQLTAIAKKKPGQRQVTVEASWPIRHPTELTGK
jgi:hypothetical protein